MSGAIFTKQDASDLQLAKKEPKDAEKVTKLKDHLYMTYLLLGIVAFGFGIFVSYKRLNGK